MSLLFSRVSLNFPVPQCARPSELGVVAVGEVNPRPMIPAPSRHVWLNFRTARRLELRAARCTRSSPGQNLCRVSFSVRVGAFGYQAIDVGNASRDLDNCFAYETRQFSASQRPIGVNGNWRKVNRAAKEERRQMSHWHGSYLPLFHLPALNWRKLAQCAVNEINGLTGNGKPMTTRIGAELARNWRTHFCANVPKRIGAELAHLST